MKFFFCAVHHQRLQHNRNILDKEDFMPVRKKKEKTTIHIVAPDDRLRFPCHGVRGAVALATGKQVLLVCVHAHERWPNHLWTPQAQWLALARGVSSWRYIRPAEEQTHSARHPIPRHFHSDTITTPWQWPWYPKD